MKTRVLIYLVIALLAVFSAVAVWTLNGRSLGSSADAVEISGTYELTERVMQNGEALSPPNIAALYTLDHGRGNFNLFYRKKDGSLASESTVSRYTLSAEQYCEWIVYTIRSNIDAPGATNQVPPVPDHCSHITVQGGRIVFAPPGEGVESSFDKEGFTATVAGQFVDHWRKVR